MYTDGQSSNPGHSQFSSELRTKTQLVMHRLLYVTCLLDEAVPKIEIQKSNAQEGNCFSFSFPRLA
jgi:hypothetical protein